MQDTHGTIHLHTATKATAYRYINSLIKRFSLQARAVFHSVHVSAYLYILFACMLPVEAKLSGVELKHFHAKKRPASMLTRSTNTRHPPLSRTLRASLNSRANWSTLSTKRRVRRQLVSERSIFEVLCSLLLVSSRIWFSRQSALARKT